VVGRGKERGGQEGPDGKRIWVRLSRPSIPRSLIGSLDWNMHRIVVFLDINFYRTYSLHIRSTDQESQ